jgi:hydrogenase expression/formation protein HypE
VRDLPGLRFMRDPTRGGLATVAHEIARACGHSVALDQAAVPLRPQVVSVCEMLGYDPYYLACEGRIVAVADAATANEILARWQALPQGVDACLIGRIEAGDSRVILQTSLGGRRILDELEDDPLPRIC